MSTPQKAYLQTETGTRLDCLFNPAKLEVVLESSWEGRQIPGQQAPTQRFGGGQSGRIPGLELLFDTTGTGESVTTFTDALTTLIRIDEDLPGFDAAQHNGRPAWVQFHWGSFHSFKAVITRLAISFNLFSPTGEPLRALATLDLTQYQDENDYPRQNPTSGTPMPARSHRVQPGETLDRIAAIHYDDPTIWRRLAEANAVHDPFALRPGTRLDVPTLEN
ncbi:LysM peptidoglycan-binding domain-containing protein [Nitriliruptor alkaliphilus]|uniref:CIS tube protein n=1 Tax=Nitriliruptor alkaliphilus TaxID=427918 RepID=UPI000698CAE5|nr:LysM peptidoglycan-binding domain-containing protein [Nitriliruptor alkaliphilus]